jgi:hypothetical protein
MNPSSLTRIYWITVSMLLMCYAAVSSAEVDLSLKPFLEVRYGYEDNVLQVSEESESQNDYLATILAGMHIDTQFDEKTRGSTRYEAVFRRFADFDRCNRQDHLLSLLFHRKLRYNVSLLSIGNLGMRSQPDDRINNYYKQSLAAQAGVRWNPLWSSQFGMQFRHKSYPHNRPSNYSSVMLEGGLGRRLGNLSQIRGGYQFRTYNGALDPRVLQLKPGEKMEGFRQVASLRFESTLAAKVLMELRYQVELDTATERLQRSVDFPRIVELTGRLEGKLEGELGDWGDEDERTDFNFTNHKATMMLAWRLFSRSTVALYARYGSKFYSDWPVPTTSKQRHDSLILLRIYLRQELSSGVSACLQYSLENNNSNDPTQKYTDNVFSIGLRLAL